MLRARCPFDQNAVNEVQPLHKLSGIQPKKHTLQLQDNAASAAYASNKYERPKIQCTH